MKTPVNETALTDSIPTRNGLPVKPECSRPAASLARRARTRAGKPIQHRAVIAIDGIVERRFLAAGKDEDEGTITKAARHAGRRLECWHQADACQLLPPRRRRATRDKRVEPPHRTRCGRRVERFVAVIQARRLRTSLIVYPPLANPLDDARRARKSPMPIDGLDSPCCRQPRAASRNRWHAAAENMI